ncbi:MAG: glucose-6-phosphate dehydrogenase [Nitrospiraceae bacterium]|nr:glucose-6-phosphate dehydrogenase [Nitrospiraceae bacterium]
MPSPRAEDNYPLTVVVVGASGDLARKKVFPALFALFCQDLLPGRFHVVGLARTVMSDERFRERIMEYLTCRYTPESDCAERMDDFLSRCTYVTGRYDSVDSFLEVYANAKIHEGDGPANRAFYMAIPPFLFLPVASAIGDAGLVACGEGATDGWSRVVIEKPFGADRESSDALVSEMAKVFTELQTFRIDHYLGKEVIQNLLVLRFANQIFGPLWSNDYIAGVDICWQEDIGVEERGGYFDQYGIVRDVMQNHLLQILALLAMEQPKSLTAHDIRDEKVNVLRQIKPLLRDDIVLGQYVSGGAGGGEHPGYREELHVPEDSVTPTYAAAVLHIETPRWQGVPFFISAGKGLNARKTEIRLRFRPVAENLFRGSVPTLPANELVVRVQPDEAISFHILNKMPGLGLDLVETDLDIRYDAKFGATIPDAYESLLLDVLRGDESLFVRSDELAAAWDIFTPVLREFGARGECPPSYPFGSEGPGEAAVLRQRSGIGG